MYQAQTNFNAARSANEGNKLRPRDRSEERRQSERSQRKDPKKGAFKRILDGKAKGAKKGNDVSKGKLDRAMANLSKEAKAALEQIAAKKDALSTELINDPKLIMSESTKQWVPNQNQEIQNLSIAPTSWQAAATTPQPVAKTIATAGSAAQQAQVAAMLERFVETMRVGRVGKNGHEVRLRIRSHSDKGGIDVQLRQENGLLTAILRPDKSTTAEAARLAEQFTAQAQARGLRFVAVDIE